MGTATGSVAWSDWELEWEAVPRSRWASLPGNLAAATMRVGANGVAEIKPHSWSGLRAGLKQLARRTSTGPRALITYLPVDRSGKTVPAGQAAAVRVFATMYAPSTSLADYLAKAQWWDLGSLGLPGMMPFPVVQNGGFFGMAVENGVRNHFTTKVLNPSTRKVAAGTGGHQHGADVQWQELAELYAELARQLRDPAYAEAA
jgi:hypothetical protein